MSLFFFHLTYFIFVFIALLQRKPMNIRERGLIRTNLYDDLYLQRGFLLFFFAIELEFLCCYKEKTSQKAMQNFISYCKVRWWH